MKIKLFLDHIKNAFNESINMVLADDGSNKSAFYCADVVGGRRFAQNYGGYPRSEIAELNEMTNIQQCQQLLSQLNDYSPSSNPNAGKTDAEIMLGHRSKYCQTAKEQIDWLDNQLKIREVEREAASQKSTDNIEFSPTDNPEGNE